MIGQTLGHYRIEAKLGEGGMGVVYKARDTRLDRPVAIKVLPRDRIADPGRKARFMQEAKAASALNHPNIVHIYGIDTASGVDFIAMEFVEGRTLDVASGRKGLKIGETLKYAAQIADALAAAHAAGIVHRDIKPSNIMVGENGLVKILDFGLAKLAEQREQDSSAPTETLQARTEEGTIVGTVPYMSPEQVEGKKADARSDIFSFGSVLYEMVSGQRAFQGENAISVLSAILHKEPAPISEAAGHPVAPELQAVIARCLRKDPQRRIQHLDDVKLTLEELQHGVTSGTPGRPRVAQSASRRRWAWAALLLALLVAGWFARRVWRAPETMEPLRAVALTTQPGVHRYPSSSPDGNYVSFTWTGSNQDSPDIYVQQIGAGSPLRLTTDPGNDYNPVWSPDGRWIAFLRSQSEAGRSELRLIPPLGGPERKLTEILVRGGAWVTPPYLAWCPDGDCLVVTDSPGEGKPDALFVISLETGEKSQLTHPQPPALADTNPTIAPDGSWLVFRRTGSLFNGELYRLPLGRGLTDAGEPRRLTPAPLNANYPAWLPGSKEILFSAKQSLWRLVVVGEEPGEGTPARLPFVGEDGLMPVVSRPQPGRPSRLVYVRSFEDYNIWRIETSAPGSAASAPPVVASLSSTRSEWFPQFSPDGRQVAFSSDRTGEGGVWLADADGSNVIQLAPMGAFATGGVRWSPDGERIAFHSNPEGQPEVYVVPAAGGKPRNLTSNRALDAFPSFSRDGKWIYFSSNRTGEFLIWKMPAPGGDAVQVTRSVGYVPLESPDGAYIYYIETFDKPSSLWRVPVSGGVPVKVLEGVVFSNFVVREGGIYYIDRPSGQGGVHFLDKPSGETRLQYFDFATGRSTTVARNLGDVENFLTVSPDGRTILYPRLDSSVDDLMLVENFR